MTHIILILPIVLESAFGGKADEWRRRLETEVIGKGDRIEFVLRQVDGETRYYLTICIKPENFAEVASNIDVAGILDD